MNVQMSMHFTGTQVPVASEACRRLLELARCLQVDEAARAHCGAGRSECGLEQVGVERRVEQDQFKPGGRAAGQPGLCIGRLDLRCLGPQPQLDRGQVAQQRDIGLEQEHLGRAA